MKKSEVIQNLNPGGMFITPETFNEYAIFCRFGSRVGWRGCENY